jgi:secreted trypsin-like serine protease
MKKTILLLFAICAVWTTEAAKTPKRNVTHKKKTITNGSTINVTTAPYQAFLPLGTTNRGGGAILNSEWILTAAHIAKLNPSNVYVGVSSVNSLTSLVQQRTVIRNIKHPDYDNSDTNPLNDLALIRVNQPLSLSTSTNATASAIRLASNVNESFYTPASNQLLAVSGYGSSTPNGTLSNDLKRVSVQVYNNTSGTSNINKIDCVGPGTNDACTGDSGGPLVAYGSSNPSSTSPPNGPLVGIVSSALFGSISTGGACGTGGRYVKVSKYVNWIYEAILEETTPNIVCGSATFTKPDVLVDGMGYYEWGTTTPSLLTLTGNTSPNPVYSSTANASGEGIITLTLYTNSTKTVLIETITKKVWVGKPGVTTFVTDGTFSFASSPPNITICKIEDIA